MIRMPPSQYITTISKSTSWGGAIELGILAAHYSTEISSVDVETGRIDHFSPESGSSTGMRAIFIYSGIHYDAASLAPMVEAPDEWHQTLFPIVCSLFLSPTKRGLIRGTEIFGGLGSRISSCEETR